MWCRFAPPGGSAHRFHRPHHPPLTGSALLAMRLPGRDGRVPRWALPQAGSTMMSRRSFLVALAIVVILSSSVGTILVLLLQYEPHHHCHSAPPEGARRVAQSKAFLSNFSDLLAEMGATAPWSARHFRWCGGSRPMAAHCRRRASLQKLTIGCPGDRRRRQLDRPARRVLGMGYVAASDRQGGHRVGRLCPPP